MPKQGGNTRLDALLGVGLKPKEQQDQNHTPAQRSTHEDGEEEEQTSSKRKSPDELASEKVTAYFTLPQYDKIEELRNAHRKKTGKRITVNALLRRLVEHATIEDILP
ncbi:hypothetical protein [Dictyobacter arantiisoli]|uniref:Uncharacterized protein n=1 Tax=Dictyobacter arantiisoli TaxID=2014874 RepID=A0A5A5TJJ7_9CHLR|nr:hypothetical protein [Dictyobacter arantiisoli]GCF11199.1 hypothetical protein KDI_47630 [Dictyobacter arantiisoli]